MCFVFHIISLPSYFAVFLVFLVLTDMRFCMPFQVLEQRSAKSANHEAYKRLQGEVAALAAVIQDPKALKEQVGNKGEDS